MIVCRMRLYGVKIVRTGWESCCTVSKRCCTVSKPSVPCQNDVVRRQNRPYRVKTMLYGVETVRTVSKRCCTASKPSVPCQNDVVRCQSHVVRRQNDSVRPQHAYYVSDTMALCTCTVSCRHRRFCDRMKLSNRDDCPIPFSQNAVSYTVVSHICFLISRKCHRHIRREP
jgi:hypothetical protein